MFSPSRKGKGENAEAAEAAPSVEAAVNGNTLGIPRYDRTHADWLLFNDGAPETNIPCCPPSDENAWSRLA